MIIAISGPSATGKTSLFEALKRSPFLEDAIFLPDLYEAVWNNLLDSGYFKDFTEISRDSEFLCLYLIRLTNYYNEMIEEYKNSDKLVILDSCWLDVSIYAIINMWHAHLIKEVQETVLKNLLVYDDEISRIYLTSNDESVINNTPKYHSPFKKYNVKVNRPLELQYYELYSNFKNVEKLPSSDVEKEVEFILSDLENLGYI